MDTTSLYLVAKTAHIGAFILAIGIVACTFIAYRHFWVLFSEDPEKGVSVFRSFNRIQTSGMVSLAVVLLAGVAMLLLMDWRLLELRWFQIKLGLVALIFLNGFTLGRSSTLQLTEFLASAGDFDRAELNRLRQKLRLFQIIQLLIYGAIIVVSVFRVD